MYRRHFVFGSSVLLTLAACTYVPMHGPPPHAPAHGHRRKHPSDLVLVYDAGLGLYIVDGWPGHYYYDNRFYRAHRDTWEWSQHIRGPWRPTQHKRLPPGLRKKRR